MTDGDRPKCIILPFQGPRRDGTGLALHFLSGNVIAVHPAFAECWFGWRVARIFPAPAALEAYCEAQGPALDVRQLGAAQKIRYWVYGRIRPQGVEMSLLDSVTGSLIAETVPYRADDHLLEFRAGFLRGLTRCGLPMAEECRPRALWPEKTSEKGLCLLGEALKGFYIYSAFGGQGGIQIKPFLDAVACAPESFMARNLLGWAHYRNAEAAAAKAAFHQALTLNPFAVGAMSGLVWCAVLEKDEQAAVHWAGRKADLSQEDVGAAQQKIRRRFSEFF